MDGQIIEKLENFFSQFDSVHKYGKGEMIVRSDEAPHGDFYLKEGYVRLYSISVDGQELTLNIFKPGSFFSMMWSIANIPNTFYFEAMTPIEVWKAPKDKVNEFLKKEPEVLFELTRRILIGLNGTLNTMESLLFGNANNKIASVLLTAAKRFGQKNSKGEVIISLLLTHQEIAGLAGLTRETTSLEMKKLENKSLISHQKRLIVIKSLEKLEEESVVSQDGDTPPNTF